MPMMRIRHMWVLVGKGRMLVPMAVHACHRPGVFMNMMAIIVSVRMLMRQGIMGVRMPMRLEQV